MATLSAENPLPPRILVIDDNPTVHDAFDAILRSDPTNAALEADEALMFGESPASDVARPKYAIDHALSGVEGVEKVRQAIAAERPYQVAFVDIRMPGIDGVETIERFWKIDPRIQTVICTAYADYRWEDLAKRLGQTDRLLMLKKPFHNVEVLQMASTLAQKWFLGQQAALKLEQMETLVAQRTQKLLESHRREHQRLEELAQSKLHYLQGLAKDFCGPLTLIVNPVEELMRGARPEPAQLELIHQNVRHLQQLVENSFQLRRLEPEDARLVVQEIELVGFVKGVLQGFQAGATERKIQLLFQTELPSHLFWTDAGKLEQVLFHLLATLLAVTANASRLFVQLHLKKDLRQIILEAALLPGTNLRLPSSASGAGLASLSDAEITLLLSQQTLGLIQGRLQVETFNAPAAKPNSGVRMTIALRETAANPPPPEISAAPAAETSAEPLTEESEWPLILLIEENADLRKFVTSGLKEEYRFAAADLSGGGLAVARESVPDLIIVDADAAPTALLEMCAKVKADPITSHIPIILLGAGLTDATRLSALEAGVDDCLPKPFLLPLLKARVGNLLENRRKLHQYFQELKTVQPRELAANKVDAEFLQRVVTVVEKNLADYEFDVEKLARLLGVSRRQLFRKFKAIAGCTPNVFMRDIRLKHAAQLLLESQLTVSEIIFAVGFSDPKYFRTVFRERFGVLPGEYGKPPKM